MQSWYNNIVTALFWTLCQYCYHRSVSELLGQPCITSLVCPSSSFQVVNSLFKLVDDLGQVVRTQICYNFWFLRVNHTTPVQFSYHIFITYPLLLLLAIVILRLPIRILMLLLSILLLIGVTLPSLLLILLLILLVTTLMIITTEDRWFTCSSIT